MASNFFHFDKEDYYFLALINRSINMDREERSLFFANLHPNGIVEMAIQGELRIAIAVLHLLDSLKKGREEERLAALRSLHEDVLVSARSSLRYNTARVLIQVMKDIVRAYGDEMRQLQLAHDFRQAATGKPTLVRKLLRRYYLLEMPEEWNQAVFDHHVHDANTKGRKNATHLIMDAWVKGIRSLTVIYYNYVAPEAARELLHAAEIMGLTIRIGLLFHAPYRGRLVDFIWIPRGFTDADGFLSFLAEPPMRRLMDEGRKASQWLETKVLRMLEHWNNSKRSELAPLLGETPAPLNAEDFLYFVGTGQASLLHLAEFIHRGIFPLLERRALEVKSHLESLPVNSQEYHDATLHLHQLDALTPEALLEKIDADDNPELEALRNAPTDPNCPEILRLTPLVLLDWLTSLHSGNRIILNLANLSAEDVLNLLWDSQGLISHLELFNLKDWQEGKASHTKAINDLQRAINDGSAPRLKQLIRSMIHNCLDEDNNRTDSDPGKNLGSDKSEMAELARHMDGTAQVESDPAPTAALAPSSLLVGGVFQPGAPSSGARVAKLRIILRNIPVLIDFYRKTKLYSRMGTDSTSRPGRRFGMGLVFPETLPPRARKEIRESTNSSRLRLPLRTELLERVTYRSGSDDDRPSAFTRFVRNLPGLSHFRKHRERDWIPVQEHTIVCNDGMCSTDTAQYTPEQGNIFTLGGIGQPNNNAFCCEDCAKQAPNTGLDYINTKLMNVLKVLAGFIPAMLTFQYTQSFWVLAWFGAPLWFLITGLRNILQAVLGGGGFRRSPLLRWNNYVSWSRLCDSLMYTGFSVVLLELLVRRMLLGQILEVNSATAPLLSFTIISLVNGFYIAGHNYLRGLQREAIIGNMFRSVFAIPVALLYNILLEGVLLLAGVQDPFPLMLASAAIISKVASDTVAGLIEGIADRNSNMRLRMWDYSSKMKQVFDIYARLEMLFPEQGVLEMLTQPKDMLQALEENGKELRLALIINALDLMYFWFFQPRASYALERSVQQLSGAERLVLLRSQQVLNCEREVSQLFVDGLVGGKFAKALSFYLDRHQEYLKDMERVCLARKR